MTGREEYDAITEAGIKEKLKQYPDYMTGFYYSFSDETSSNTKKEYINRVIRFLNAIGKDYKDITYDDINLYRASMNEDTGHSKRKSASYRMGMYAALKAFFKYMKASKRIVDNPMENVQRPKVKLEMKTSTRLNRKEIAKCASIILTKGVGSDEAKAKQQKWRERDYAIFVLFITTGIRCSALTQINIDDIDYKAGSITYVDKGKKLFKGVELSEGCLEAIAAWVKIRERLNAPTKALFVSNRKQRISPGAVSDIIEKYTRGVTNKHITPHKLRATFARELYNETLDINEVQARMGHSSPTITSALYIGKSEHGSRKSSAIMQKIISGELE